MSNLVHAPWDDVTVKLLNLQQKSHFFHSYTCNCGADLVATNEGWVCRFNCGYRQAWALEPLNVETIQLYEDWHRAKFHVKQTA